MCRVPPDVILCFTKGNRHAVHAHTPHLWEEVHTHRLFILRKILHKSDRKKRTCSSSKCLGRLSGIRTYNLLPIPKPSCHCIPLYHYRKRYSRPAHHHLPVTAHLWSELDLSLCTEDVKCLVGAWLWTLRVANPGSCLSPSTFYPRTAQ